MALTDAKLRALKPRKKPYKVADFDGLYVNVTVRGGKLWRFKYRFAEIERLLSFGAYHFYLPNDHHRVFGTL
ncbi:MAG: Arm DNA-binding domain-containing protein [Robiginitomaculum sp.]|nr:Arm DNA-binding domain-containing protein [Robiginitomaculum sp.]